MRTVIVGDLRSRHTRGTFAEVEKKLAAAGVKLAERHLESGREAMRSRIRAVIASGAQRVVIAGGDGAMTTAVGEFAHRETVMGVIPLGTGNSFAQSLGIANVDAAIAAVAGGYTQQVDLGVVNGLHFANFATIGLSSVIAGTTPHALKSVLGGAAYALSGVGPIFAARSFRAKMKVDGEKFRGRVYQIIVASGSFYGNHPLLPGARINDGRLAVFANTSAGIAGILLEFAALGSGRAASLPGAHCFSATSVRVKSDPKALLAVDGVVVGRKAARFEIDPGALRVLVPAGFTGFA